jgi:integrase
MGRLRTKQNRHLPPGMHFKSGAYYIVTTSKPRKWLRLSSDRHEAWQKYAELLPTVERRGRTFGDLATECIKSAQWAKLAPRTRDDYDTALENLLRVFGDAPVTHIRETDVGRYMDLRSSIHGANREKAVLSKILQLGIRWGWCTQNVAQKINYHPTEARRRILTRTEWRAIWLAGLDPLPVFMDLAFITGLRVGDVLALQWSQVREEGLYVLQAKNQVEGLYEMTQGLHDVLERAKRLHLKSDSVSPLLKPDTAIIHTKKFKPYKYAGIRSSWDRACVRAEVEGVRIHDIRRTAITMAKLSGRNPQEFSLHKTAAQAAEYVVEVPRVRPLEVLR